MTTNDHGEKSILDRIVAAKRKRIEEDKAGDVFEVRWSVRLRRRRSVIRIQAAAWISCGGGHREVKYSKRDSEFRRVR